MHPSPGPVGHLCADTLNRRMAECVAVKRSSHDMHSLSVLPFYNISNYELVNTILFQSQSTRNDKFCNSTFYNALKCNVTSNIMEHLALNITQMMSLMMCLVTLVTKLN